MKIKNIKVGDYIESKNIHGGDKVYPILKTGEKYKVLEIDEDMHELPIMIAVPGHKIFGDGFWVHPKSFRKPKLKVLDQSVFDGEDEKWRFAAVDEDSRAFKFDCEPAINCDEWYEGHGQQKVLIGTGYDTSNWQNSLIERESKELTGSKLAVAYFKAGGQPHICYVGDDGDENTNDLNIELITRFCAIDGFISSRYDASANALLIDSNGNELTAKEVGL